MLAVLRHARAGGCHALPRSWTLSSRLRAAKTVDNRGMPRVSWLRQQPQINALVRLVAPCTTTKGNGIKGSLTLCRSWAEPSPSLSSCLWGFSLDPPKADALWKPIYKHVVKVQGLGPWWVQGKALALLELRSIPSASRSPTQPASVCARQTRGAGAGMSTMCNRRG